MATSHRFRIAEHLARIADLTGLQLGRQEFIDAVLEEVIAMGFERARFWEITHDVARDRDVMVLTARLPADSSGKRPGHVVDVVDSDLPRNPARLRPMITDVPLPTSLNQLEEELDLGGRIRVGIPVTAGIDLHSYLGCDWRGSSIDLPPEALDALRVVGSQIGSYLALEPFDALPTVVNRRGDMLAPSEYIFQIASDIAQMLDAAITSVFVFSWPKQQLIKVREFTASGVSPNGAMLPETYSVQGPQLTGTAWREKSFRHIISTVGFKDHDEVVLNYDALAWYAQHLGTDVRTVLYAPAGTLERRFLLRFINRASRPELPFLREAHILETLMRDVRSDLDTAISLQRLRSLQEISLLTAGHVHPAEVVRTIGGALNSEAVDNFIALCHPRDSPQFSFALTHGDRVAGIAPKLDSAWHEDSLYAVAVEDTLSVIPLSDHRDGLPDHLAPALSAKGFRAVLAQPMQAGQTEGALLIPLDVLPSRKHAKGRTLPEDLGYGTTALVYAYSRLLANSVEMHRSQERFLGARRAYGLLGHEVRSPASAVGSAGLQAIVAARNAAPAISDGHTRQDLLAKLDGIERNLRVAQGRLGSALRLSKLVARETEGTLRLTFAPARLTDLIKAAVDDVEQQTRNEAMPWPHYISYKGAAEDLGTIVCDEYYLIQVFKNLLANAIKYSLPRHPRRGGQRRTVGIHVIGEPQTQRVDIKIRNWGWAIPEDKRDVIFEPWVRGNVEGEAAALPGMGFGLFLARRLMLAHEGHILCSSIPTDDVYYPRAVEGSKPSSVTVYETTFEVRVRRDLNPGVRTHHWGPTAGTRATREAG